jgi:hypothetical protein
MRYKLIAALAAALVCRPGEADTVTVTASGVLFLAWTVGPGINDKATCL